MNPGDKLFLAGPLQGGHRIDRGLLLVLPAGVDGS
jgi:hypothetical protein